VRGAACGPLGCRECLDPRRNVRKHNFNDTFRSQCPATQSLRELAHAPRREKTYAKKPIFSGAGMARPMKECVHRALLPPIHR